MDFDLEIISEEGDRQDPLFDSIMNAMSSMKEATADKIYQKIQKEGATNYSKPQVDRALASALKYGIFEVKNNRYRVRDDALDDEDTVYWKFQKKRDQTPFRIQEDMNDKQTGPKLDPERDNQRFKKPSENFTECPHCGRTKRTSNKGKAKRPNQKSKRKRRRSKRTKNKEDTPPESDTKAKKRKVIPDKSQEEDMSKRKRPNMTKLKSSEIHIQYSDDKLFENIQKDMIESQDGTSDSSDTDMEVLTASDNKYKSFKGKQTVFRKRNTAPSSYLPNSMKADLDLIKLKTSNASIKTESGSEKETCTSSISEIPSQMRASDGFFESPCTSKNTSTKLRNQYLQSGEMYRNQYNRGQNDKNMGNSDWLGCSDEPQGAIIQSNNVLTIEPMDSLTFKNPEQASYIS